MDSFYYFRDDDREKSENIKLSSSEESVKRQASSSNDSVLLDTSQTIWNTIPTAPENTTNDLQMIINPSREVLETTV